MELDRIAIRAVFAYVVLLGLLRASGKRTIAEGTPFAFVLALVLGDMVDDVLWAEVGAARFVVAVTTLTIAQIVVAWASSRFDGIDRLVSGAPAPLVLDGATVRSEQRSQRMNDKVVAFELRHHGLDDGQWGQVKSAHVEANGAVSVIRTRADRPAERRDAPALRERVERA